MSYNALQYQNILIVDKITDGGQATKYISSVLIVRQTRMHSSRKRTVRCSGRRGGVGGGGVCPSACWDIHPLPIACWDTHPLPSACWDTHSPSSACWDTHHPCPVHAGIHTCPAQYMLGYTPQCILGYTPPSACWDTPPTPREQND